MNRLFLAISLLFSLFSFAVAQPKLGLKFSPLIVNSRTDPFSDTLDILSSGNQLKFSIGLTVDQSLTDTYFLSTGLIYTPKHVKIKINGENGGSYKNSVEDYKLQYLQVPISLKLYTNEIAPDFSIYFQIGAIAEFKINDLPVKEEYTLIKDFSAFDTSVLFGAGAEYRAGINTVLYIGGSYQRGMMNVVKNTTPALGNDFNIRTGVISIDFGIKF